MRAYPPDSPEAAARIVALSMLADGHVCQREMQALEALHAAERLQLAPGQLRAVLQGLAQDLLASVSAHWDRACQVDDHTLGLLLAEVNDPALRATTLALCQQLVQADGHRAPAEQRLMARLAQQWGESTRHSGAPPTPDLPLGGTDASRMQPFCSLPKTTP